MTPNNTGSRQSKKKKRKRFQFCTRIFACWVTLDFKLFSSWLTYPCATSDGSEPRLFAIAFNTHLCVSAQIWSQLWVWISLTKWNDEQGRSAVFSANENFVFYARGDIHTYFRTDNDQIHFKQHHLMAPSEEVGTTTIRRWLTLQQH